MIEKIKKYKDDFKNRISGIGIGDELRQLRTDFLGKKGLVTQVMKDMRELSSEQKREVGRHVNELKNWIENEIKEKTEKLKGSSTDGADRTLDITLPGRKEARGSLHPITHVMDELIAIFTGKGPHTRDYRRGATVTIEKGIGSKYLELEITDRVKKLQPEFVIKEWE